MSTIIDYKSFNVDDFSRSLGQRWKQERLRLGLSQEEFASKGGVSRATAYLYESGDRVPSMEFLVRLLSIGVDLGFLIYGERGSANRISPIDSKLSSDIFEFVDECARDKKGRPLPAKDRFAIFNSLRSSLAGQAERGIDWESVRNTLKSRRKNSA